jgi:hypothetical protein
MKRSNLLFSSLPARSYAYGYFAYKFQPGTRQKKIDIVDSNCYASNNNLSTDWPV